MKEQILKIILKHLKIKLKTSDIVALNEAAKEIVKKFKNQSYERRDNEN